MKTKGIADEVDKYVGNRLRVRRSLMGFSQEKLAEFVGVTFQQIQKYERGSNRLSSSRLYNFSKMLDVPVSYFFEDIENQTFGFAENDQEAFEDTGSKIKDKSIFNQKETIDLLKAYYAVPDAKRRKEILKLVKSMSKNMT